MSEVTRQAPRPREPVPETGPPVRRSVVVSGLSSDAHTWNLVFLQLLVEELGFDVTNLGPCVPPELLVARCRALAPTMVVLSSVNGHGYHDGLRAIAELRGCRALAGTVVVLGGKLGLSADHRAEHVRALLAAGYDAVYDDDTDHSTDFRELARSLAAVTS